MEIINEIKTEYRKNKILVVTMFGSLGIGILSFLKSDYTQSIAGYIGLSIFNLGIFAILIFIIWWFFIRGKK